MKNYFESLERQSFKDFEVILIDDCSTDNSFEQIRKYENISRLKITSLRSSQNCGAGMSRNIGIKEAKGEFLLFLDSDDYLDVSCLREIDKVIEDSNCECLIYDYYREDKGLHYGHSIPNFPAGYVEKETAIAFSTGSVCCKVYKSDIIKSNKVHFPSLKRFEDLVFNKLAMKHCNNFHYLKKALYYYVSNPLSIVNSGCNMDEKYATEAFEIIENNYSDEYQEEMEIIFARELLYSSTLMMTSKQCAKKEVVSHIEHWSSKYPKWYKNRGLSKLPFHQRAVLIFIRIRAISALRIINYLRSRH
jgi:glycosyltransferase involved in cell wall biosynthesis